MRLELRKRNVAKFVSRNGDPNFRNEVYLCLQVELYRIAVNYPQSTAERDKSWSNSPLLVRGISLWIFTKFPGTLLSCLNIDCKRE